METTKRKSKVRIFITFNFHYIYFLFFYNNTFLQPRCIFSPDDYENQETRKPKNVCDLVNKKGKIRNTAVVDESKNGCLITKWDIYKKNALKFIRLIEKQNFILDVYQKDKGREKGFGEGEIKNSFDTINQAKSSIKELIEQLVKENSDHKSFLQLEIPDEDDCINVEEVYCSKCGLDSTDQEADNDIVLCDRIRCNKAYHFKCCDPPIQPFSAIDLERDDEWFCWKCEALDDILDHLNSRLETNYDELNIFPELATVNNMNSSNLSESENDEESDADYDPNQPESELSNSNDESSGSGSGSGSGSDSDNTDSQSHDDDDDDDSIMTNEVNSCDSSVVSKTEIKYLLAESDIEANNFEPSSSGYKLRTRSIKPKKKYSMITNPQEFVGLSIKEVMHLPEQSVKSCEEGEEESAIGRVIECFIDNDNEQHQEGQGNVDSQNLSDSISINKYKWTICIDDSIIIYDYNQLIQGLEAYEASQETVQQFQQIHTSFNQVERVDASNIISHQRKKQRVDYSTLNLLVIFLIIYINLLNF